MGSGASRERGVGRQGGTQRRVARRWQTECGLGVRYSCWCLALYPPRVMPACAPQPRHLPSLPLLYPALTPSHSSPARLPACPRRRPDKLRDMTYTQFWQLVRERKVDKASGLDGAAGGCVGGHLVCVGWECLGWMERQHCWAAGVAHCGGLDPACAAPPQAAELIVLLLSCCAHHRIGDCCTACRCGTPTTAAACTSPPRPPPPAASAQASRDSQAPFARRC